MTQELMELPADRLPPQQRLERLVRELRQMPPVECPLQHHFSRGVYGREMRIPAGAVVVGKVHKFQNMLVMMAGEAEILLGDEPQRVCAPYVWISPPGTQRAVYAHTDCVFMAVHGTDKTDLAEIEAEFIAQNMLEYEQFRLALEAKEGDK